MAADPLDAALNIGAIPLENTAIFMCDLQEKFRPAMLHFAQVIMNAKKLVCHVCCFRMLVVTFIFVFRIFIIFENSSTFISIISFFERWIPQKY